MKCTIHQLIYCTLVHIQIQEREKLKADPIQIRPTLRAPHDGKRQLGSVNLNTEVTDFTFAQPDACL
jgi:hypothetical protein